MAQHLDASWPLGHDFASQQHQQQRQRKAAVKEDWKTQRKKNKKKKKKQMMMMKKKKKMKQRRAMPQATKRLALRHDQNKKKWKNPKNSTETIPKQVKSQPNRPHPKPPQESDTEKAPPRSGDSKLAPRGRGLCSPPS